MEKLLFLLTVFIVALGLSFYFSAEGFEAANTSALQSELVELNKTMDYLKGLGINAGSQNDTYDKTAKRIKEINNILTPPDPMAELWAELGELDKTMNYLKSLGINAGSNNDTYDKTVKRIGEINAIIAPPPPMAAPMAAPVAAPVAAPMAAPVAAPMAAPVAAPIAAPVAAPVPIPQPAPNTTTDANGNVISNRLKDLISILRQPAIPVVPANVAAQQQARTSVPASTSDNSGNEISLASFYEMIKPQIQNDVSQAVRKEFERSTVLPKKEQRSAPTPSIAQGASWQSGSGCNGGGQYAQPDMSEYIRKDSIPCWGCDVNY